MHHAHTFYTLAFCIRVYTLYVCAFCVNLALCVAMAPEVNYLPLNPILFKSRDDRHWLQRTRLADFHAMPIAAQPVRPDLTKIIMKADFSRKVLVADGREHFVSAALVSERLHLPLDGCASHKDAAKLSDAYFAERFS